MGLGPVLCSTAILKRHGLSLGDIELWELNEAFAAQVLACLAAWEDETFCRDVLDLSGAAGRIDRDKLNVDGGAIGLGHPVGASGNRIVLHLVNAMKRLGLKRGIATECIGGGQGGAMLIESGLGARRMTKTAWDALAPRNFDLGPFSRATDERASSLAALEAAARRRRHRLAPVRQEGTRANTLVRSRLPGISRCPRHPRARAAERPGHTLGQTRRIYCRRRRRRVSAA